MKLIKTTIATLGAAALLAGQPALATAQRTATPVAAGEDLAGAGIPSNAVLPVLVLLAAAAFMVIDASNDDDDETTPVSP